MTKEEITLGSKIQYKTKKGVKKWEVTFMEILKIN